MRALAAAVTEGAVFGVPGVVVEPGAEVVVRGVPLRVARVGASGVLLVGSGRSAGVEVVVAGGGVSARVWGVEGLSEEDVVARVVERGRGLAGAKVVVGAAVVGERGVLAQQRSYPPAVAGLWEFPGGKVEADESDVDAVRRECREELGVEVEPGRVVGPDVVLRDDLVLRLYAARLVSGEPVAAEHAAVRWLSDVDEVTWLPADRVLLPAVRDLLALGAGSAGVGAPGAGSVGAGPARDGL